MHFAEEIVHLLFLPYGKFNKSVFILYDACKDSFCVFRCKTQQETLQLGLIVDYVD